MLFHSAPSTESVSVMLLLIAAVFLLKRYGTQAVALPAPTPPSGTFEAPIFARDDPSSGCQGRTVLDILWSCLATTFACTWVSVHPNVPVNGEGEWTLRFRRVFLMFFSILAPEFMIMWAFKQWRGAVMIREAVNEAILEASTDKHNPVRELWTTTHGHLLQMGGFRLCITERENFFWGGSVVLGKRAECPVAVNDGHPLFAYISRTRRTFMPNMIWDRKREVLISDSNPLIPEILHYRHETSEGTWTTDFSSDAEPTDDIWEGGLSIHTLKQLLSENLTHLPTITEDEINDRSKGDALSKAIALLQLTWFIVQIVTRAVQGLAITELELTTAALAGLNSVMYIFWWSKPRDVRFPVVVRTKGVEELLERRHPEDVAWCFSRQDFDIREHLWASFATWIKKYVETVKTSPRRFELSLSRVGNLLSKSRKPTTIVNESEMLLAEDDEPPNKLENRTKRFALTILYGAKMAMKSAFIPFFCLIYIIDVVLFIPIAKILKTHDTTSISGSFLGELGGHDFSTEDKTFSMIFYSENAGARPLLGTSSIAGTLFGAAHCLAWHFSFPSHAEKIMWRTASLGVVGSCAGTFLIVLYFDLIGRLDSVLYFLGLAPGALASFVYPVARITLLVLAITSLRSLPPSALDTVDWDKFFPHI